MDGSVDSNDDYTDRFGHHDNYTFSGEEGDTVAIELRQLISNDDSYTEIELLLINPSGEVEARQNNAGRYYSFTNVSVETTLDESGTYTIVVASYNDGDTFDYNLQLYTRLSPGKDIAYGDSVSDAITPDDRLSDDENFGGDSLPSLNGYHDNYHFTGEAGDTVAIELRQLIGEDDSYTELELLLISPSGEVEARQNNAGRYYSFTNVSVETTLDESGTYTVVVAGFNDRGTFDYNLRLYERRSPGKDIAYGDSVSDAITPDDRLSDDENFGGDSLPSLNGYHDNYHFTGEAGETVTIELRQLISEDESWTQIELLLINPSGEVEARQHNAGDYYSYTNVSVETTLDESGTYTVVVAGYKDTGTFDYNLRLYERLNTETSLRYGGSVSDAVTTDDRLSDDENFGGDSLPGLNGYHDNYHFTGEAGETVAIELRQLIGEDDSWTEIELLLINPSGEVEARQHNAGDYYSYTNVSVETTLDESGTYTIVVAGFDPAGTFDYNLRLYERLSPEKTLRYGGSVTASITTEDKFSDDENFGNDDLLSLKGYHDNYQFPGEKGDVVTIGLKQLTDDSESQYRTRIYLISPSGEVQTVASDSEDGATLETTLGETGDYIVIATADETPATFDYELSLTADTSSTPPEATFEFSPASPTVGEQITFDASESTDTDGSIDSYEWDFNGDGTVDATGQTASFTFDEPADYTVSLIVTDSSGNSDEVSRTVTVESQQTTTAVPTTTRPQTTTAPPTTTRSPTTTAPPTTTRLPTTTVPPTTTRLPTTTVPPTTTRLPTTTAPPTTTRSSTTRPRDSPTTTAISTTAVVTDRQDSDGDGVVDENDYAPNDPNVQDKSDIGSSEEIPGFRAVGFLSAVILFVCVALRRR